ncbi:MAG: hypothetical protein ACI90V_007040, partial [Bacillariaceae sp.]
QKKILSAPSSIYQSFLRIKLYMTEKNHLSLSIYAPS